MRGARVIAVPAVLLLAGVILDDGSAQPSQARIVKHYTPADRVSGRYQYVPFDVPPGTARLQIAYDYDRDNGENVVDLGLFEPGVLDLGTPAFRGYSGGAKKSIDITAESATPGYKRWPDHARPMARAARPVQSVRERRRCHGRYRNHATCERTCLRHLTHLRTAPHLPHLSHPCTAPHPTHPAHLAHLTHLGWLTGALHTHTLHSDGTVTPAELLRMAARAGFDFVAITDHNNTTHRAESERRRAPQANGRCGSSARK